MNSILTSKGEYLSTYFISKNKDKWELIGTESTGSKAIDSIDTFINRRNSKYFTKTRTEIYDAAELKSIKIN